MKTSYILNVIFLTCISIINWMMYGFTFIVEVGIEKPQCVICNEIMSAESMKPNKMKRHFDAKHRNFAGKDVQYFKNKADGVKKSGLILAASTNRKYGRH